MSFLRYLGWPLAVLMDVITRVRNYLYNIGHKKSFRFSTVVISVGNLNVGGSGKTPMIEYLVRLLGNRYKVATLSRGYGRTTRGFRLAGAADDARTLGDEPYQLYKKFNQIYVAVGEERALAIPTLLNECPDVQVILLDDAFQHRSVVPQFSVLVTDYQKPFFQDYLLPVGRLREARAGAARCDAVVVTKSKDEWRQNQQAYEHAIIRYAPGKPVYFSAIKYSLPVPMGSVHTLTNEVVLVTGIGNAVPFEQHIGQQFTIHKHYRFEDHHRYKPGEVLAIGEEAGGRSIITTEKDMVKLVAPALQHQLQAGNWFYLPMQAVFAENGSEFDSMIEQVVALKLEEADSPV